MRLPGTPIPLDILYVVVTVCVSIHMLQTKYLTALGGTSKLSSHFPLHSTSVLFGFSSASLQGVKHYLSHNADGRWYTSSRDMEYPGTAWAEYVAQVCKAGLQFLSESNSRTWEQRTLALAGWDRVEGLGPGQYLRSIDTHLQFLHTPTLTPHNCELYSRVHSSLCCFLTIVFNSYIAPLWASHSLSIVFHSWSSAFLCLSLHVTVRRNLFDRNTHTFMVLKPPVACLCFLSSPLGIFMLWLKLRIWAAKL